MRKSLVSMAIGAVVSAGLAAREAIAGYGATEHWHQVVPVSGVHPVGKSWVLYGPQGCGKTLHAEALAKALGCCAYVDGWDMSPDSFDLSKGWLYLAQDRPAWVPVNARRCITFHDAFLLAYGSSGAN